ncbi:ATP synthase F0 subunit B [candidate division KSB1 bacterium]|nr:F0F1 ATP synthase subunit B [candidate division KSB1 bacterium]RQW02564.1 MAG: ATP synthase F0 subunit B [candidate division KSB1 bacterium]
MDLMTPEGGTIVWTAVTFVALAFILYKIGWKPILHMLEERELRIQESLDAAERAKDDARKIAEERQKQIDQARQEAHDIIHAARSSAEALREDIINNAQAEAEKLIERAKREISLSRDKAIHDMRDLAIELSMMATEKLIRQKLSKEEHDAMIHAAMEKIEQLN